MGATIKIQSLSFEAIGQALEKNTVESFHFQSEIKNQCYKTTDVHIIEFKPNCQSQASILPFTIKTLILKSSLNVIIQ